MLEGTTRQISFCEDDWEISNTSARISRVVADVLPRTSGTPAIAGPPTVINAASVTAVSAVTPLLPLEPAGVILVPGFSGAKVLRIQRGIPLCASGRKVLG